MLKLFIYGTLGLPEVQKKVIGREAPAQPEILRNFGKSKIRINGATYPIAVYQPGEQLEGACIEVTERELKLVDEYETVAYKRVEVELLSGVKAWVYTRA